jgi:hypothetical protein
VEPELNLYAIRKRRAADACPTWLARDPEVRRIECDLAGERRAIAVDRAVALVEMEHNVACNAAHRELARHAIATGSNFREVRAAKRNGRKLLNIEYVSGSKLCVGSDIASPEAARIDAELNNRARQLLVVETKVDRVFFEAASHWVFDDVMQREVNGQMDEAERDTRARSIQVPHDDKLPPVSPLRGV